MVQVPFPAQTVHFNIGTLGAPTLAPVGVPTPAALAFFGQINIDRATELRFSHLHLITGGAVGQELHLELYRRRGSTMTQLTAMDYVSVGGETFITRGGTPAAELALLREGDYLMCQAVVGSTGAPGDGLTCDCHFRYAPGRL